MLAIHIAVFFTQLFTFDSTWLALSFERREFLRSPERKASPLSPRRGEGRVRGVASPNSRDFRNSKPTVGPIVLPVIIRASERL